MIKRKSFIKTALALLLAGSFISLCGTVSAESIYKGEFLKNEYVFYKIDDNFSSEELNNYDFCDFPVGGKTQISFDFSTQIHLDYSLFLLPFSLSYSIFIAYWSRI